MNEILIKKKQNFEQEVNQLIEFINCQNIYTSKCDYIKALNNLDNLCKFKVKLICKQTGTKQCKYCQKLLNYSENQQQQNNEEEIVPTNYCLHSYHINCLKSEIEKISPNFDYDELQQKAKCPQCQKQISYDLIEKLFTKKYITEIRNDFSDKKTFQCPVCFQDLNINTHCVTLNCDHQICKDCLRGQIDSNIQEGKCNSKQMRCSVCPDNDFTMIDDITGGQYYRSQITPPMILQYCSQELQSRYYQLTQVGLIQQNQGKLIKCPGKLIKPQNIDQDPVQLNIIQLIGILNDKMPENVELLDCPFIFSNELQSQQFKTHCFICSITFCINCRDQAHNGTCEEFKKEKQRIEEEAKKQKAQADQIVQDNALFQLFMEQNDIRICPNPNCKLPIQKNGGCNRVTCSKCGKSMCWKNKCMLLFNTANECYAHLNAVHGGYFD